MSSDYAAAIERGEDGRPVRLVFARVQKAVTGKLGPLAAIKCEGCGGEFLPKRRNQTCHPGRCYDKAYNAAHPVARQKLLPLTPEPIRVHTPPHNPALAHKLKPATLNVLGLLGDGQAHSRHELYRVGGTRYSARVEELRAAGHRVLGPSKSIRWGIYECEPAGPGGLEMYRLEGGK